MEATRFDQFPMKLRLALVAAQGNLTIALRVDGGIEDSNVLLRTYALYERCLRVQAAGGLRRADSWNIVTMITDVIMRNTPLQKQPLPDGIQAAYEKGINQLQSGWVVMRVANWRPVTARATTVP